jgi:hypothetical protein
LFIYLFKLFKVFENMVLRRIFVLRDSRLKKGAR